jgi:hypothetical protein
MYSHSSSAPAVCPSAAAAFAEQHEVKMAWAPVSEPVLQAWGKCDQNWMLVGGYCRLTCGHCTPPAGGAPSGQAAAAPTAEQRPPAAQPPALRLPWQSISFMPLPPPPEAGPARPPVQRQQPPAPEVAPRLLPPASPPLRPRPCPFQLPARQVHPCAAFQPVTEKASCVRLVKNFQCQMPNMPAASCAWHVF